MPDGVSMIKETAEVCRTVAEGLGEFGTEKGAAEAKARLLKIADGLDNISGKLFFKTKAALPFATPLLDYAQQVQAAFEEAQAAPAGKRSGPLGDLTAALDDLDNDHGVLQAKVASQDIIIT
jgi:hypothetical protein